MVPEGAVAGELIHVVVDMKPYNVAIAVSWIGVWAEFGVIDSKLVRADFYLTI